MSFPPPWGIKRTLHPLFSLLEPHQGGAAPWVQLRDPSSQRPLTKMLCLVVFPYNNQLHVIKTELKPLQTKRGCFGSNDHGEGHSCTLGTIGMGSWMLQRLSPHPPLLYLDVGFILPGWLCPILGNVPTLLSSCSSYSPWEKDWGLFSLPWYPRELAQMESGLLPEPITGGQQHRGCGRWQLPWLVELKRPPGDSCDSKVRGMWFLR